MRRMILGALGLVLAASTAGAQQTTEQERRDLEKRLSELRQEMREIQQKLGTVDTRLRIIRPEGMAFSILTNRPRLGVVLQSARDPGTDSIGAVLQAVTPDGPAAEAGLQAGDIIVRFNDERLGTTGKSGESPGDKLIAVLRTLDEGDSVQVQYRRGKETETTIVVPRRFDDNTYAWSFTMPDSAFRVDSLVRASRLLADRMRDIEVTPHVNAFLGQGPWLIGERWSDMELTTLDKDLGSYFGTTEGLLVVRAPRDSLLNLRSGDVILRIGGRVPTSPSHAMRILRSYEPGDQIRMDIMRNKKKTEITAVVPKRDRGLLWEERN
jgi:S1-C subfamily serine protease